MKKTETTAACMLGLRPSAQTEALRARINE